MVIISYNHKSYDLQSLKIWYVAIIEQIIIRNITSKSPANSNFKPPEIICY